MPGFVTHYIFGVNAYKQIDNNDIHDIVYRNRQAYCLGLQGPEERHSVLSSEIKK